MKVIVIRTYWNIWRLSVSWDIYRKNTLDTDEKQISSMTYIYIWSGDKGGRRWNQRGMRKAGNGKEKKSR